jgi:hypothetical protein
MPKPETTTNPSEVEQEILRIGIVLLGQLVVKFEALKQRYGIQSNSDMVRFLVSDKFEQIGTPTPLAR